VALGRHRYAIVAVSPHPCGSPRYPVGPRRCSLERMPGIRELSIQNNFQGGQLEHFNPGSRMRGAHGQNASRQTAKAEQTGIARSKAEGSKTAKCRCHAKRVGGFGLQMVRFPCLRVVLGRTNGTPRHEQELSSLGCFAVPDHILFVAVT